MAKRLSVSESPVARRHTFSSMLDEPLEETIASDMETVTEGNTAESNDVSPAINGKNVFSVPVLRNIEKFIYYNCRDQIVATLNEKLFEGELSSILHTAIVAEEIKRESCLLTNHTAWWLNQTDFLVDVDITLTNIMSESETGDRLTNFGIYVTFWFTTCVDFDYEIQEVGALMDKPDRNLVKMDRYGASIMSVECIESATEEMWNMKVEGSMEDADKRRAFRMAEALDLSITRMRLADRPDDEYVLFFRGGTVMVQDPPPEGSNKLPPPREEDVSADTIVLNTAVDPHDDYALAIYSACFAYYRFYSFFAFNDIGDTRLDLIKRRKITSDSDHGPRDPLAFIPGVIRRGGFALMMPASIMQKKVWREYQRASTAPAPIGYVHHAGWRYEQVIRNIAEEYCLKPFRVRQRIVSLGNIAAKGAMNYDPDLGRYFVPFAFSTNEGPAGSGKGRLRRSEALPIYSITRGALFRLYRNNPSMRKLFSAGEFAFIDGLVCVSDTEFIQSCNGYYRMTASANADVSTSCLRFFTDYAHGHTVYHFDREAYKKYAVVFDRHSVVTLSEREEERQRVLNDLPESFPDALKHLMHNRPAGRLNVLDLAIRSGLPETTVNRYCTDPQAFYDLEEVLLICLALNLPPWLSSVLLEKANLAIVRTGAQAHYGFILDCLYLENVAAVQAFLKGNKYHELAKESYSQESGREDDDNWRNAI